MFREGYDVISIGSVPTISNLHPITIADHAHAHNSINPVFHVPDCSDMPYFPAVKGMLKPKLFLVGKSAAAPALALLNATVAICPREIRPGAYHRYNEFVFFASDDVEEAEVWSDENVRMHGSVAVAREVGLGIVIRSVASTTLYKV